MATALSGGKLEMKDKLKLAGTEVLALVVQDEGGVLPQPDDADPATDSDLPPAAAITTTAAAVVVVDPLATAADTGTGAAEGKRRQSFDPDAGGLDSELEALMSEEGTRVVFLAWAWFRPFLTWLFSPTPPAHAPHTTPLF